MKNTIIRTIGFILLLSTIFSCTNDKLSLQQFIVNQQEKSEIISFDLPVSMLALQSDMQSTADIETMKSLKKATILAYKIEDSNKETYTADKEQIKAIFKQEKYAELFRFGKGSKGAKIYVVGNDDTFDELIVFGNDNELGWIVVRILGKDMQPEKIMKMMQKIDLDSDDSNLDALKGLFKDYKF